MWKLTFCEMWKWKLTISYQASMFFSKKKQQISNIDLLVRVDEPP